MDELGLADGWQGALRSVAERSGDFPPLGSRHWAFFTRARRLLLVTFETLASLRDSDDGMPRHFALARALDWSLMTIICESDIWWHDPAVFSYLDRLSDRGFLEAFDQVVFYGAGTACSATARYSATMPGAEVVLVAPRAAGDPGLAGWDSQLHRARRIDLERSCGSGSASAGRIWLIFDPLHQPDTTHAALFRQPRVTPLRARHTGAATEERLAEMHALDRILEAVMARQFCPIVYAGLWRARRRNADYLGSILAQARLTGHPRREAKICRSVTSRLTSPRFLRRLAELNGGCQ